VADIGRNAPCPCGSGKKFKKCRMENKTFPSGNGNLAHARDDDYMSTETAIDYGEPILNDVFFSTNTLHEFSSPRLIYSCLINPHIEGLANKVVRQGIKRGEEELNRIKTARDVKTLIDIMKESPDSINHESLMNRLVEEKHNQCRWSCES